MLGRPGYGTHFRACPTAWQVNSLLCVSNSTRIFQWCRFEAAAGRVSDLQDLIQDTTLGLFARHGLTVLGFWTPLTKGGEPAESLAYLLAFEDREAADAAWAGFHADPAWTQAYAKSNEAGQLIVGAELTYLVPTEYSPLA